MWLSRVYGLTALPIEIRSKVITSVARWGGLGEPFKEWPRRGRSK